MTGVQTCALPIYGVDATARPLPEASLTYWIRANTLALETARRLGLDHLVVNFDRLCTDPQRGVAELLRFLGRNEAEGPRLAALITPPDSLGRYRDHDLSFVTDADRRAIRNLGFEMD